MIALSRRIGAPSTASVGRYLAFHTDALLVRQLQPWFENLGKLQIKSPGVYVRDSGLLHALLQLPDRDALLAHPKLGASWEGFRLAQVRRHARPAEFYFWATHQGAELDLLMLKHGRRIGVEFKRTDAPMLAPSMRNAMQDLKLDQLIVVYPGTKRMTLAESVVVLQAVGVAGLVG